MVVPETTGIQQSGWNVLINAGVKVLDVIVAQIQYFEFADVELRPSSESSCRLRQEWANSW